MNGDLLILLLGGIIAILSSVVTYYLNYILRIKEQSISREFTMRKEARHFFQTLYGIVSRLTDFMRSYTEEDIDKPLMLSKVGYKRVLREEIVKEYKNAYKEGIELWSKAAKEGFEIFLPPDLADELAVFWAFASFLKRQNNWKEVEKELPIFVMRSERIMDMIEESLGLKRRTTMKRPKWLRWRQIRSIIKGEKAA